MTFLAEWGDRSQLATIVLASANDLAGVILGGITGLNHFSKSQPDIDIHFRYFRSHYLLGRSRDCGSCGSF